MSNAKKLLERYCPSCEDTLDINEFWTTATGYSSYCAACSYLKSAIHYLGKGNV